MRNPDLQIERPSTTLRGQVEEKLRQAIAVGVFRPGQRLVERELCETFGVGRTSVREALRKLEAEGLITSSPHRGPVVSTMTSEEAEQLYALRALLEGYAAKCCAEYATDELKDKLEAAVQVFVEAAASNEIAALVEAKALFYSLLLEGSGNVFIRRTLIPLHTRIQMLRFTSMTLPDRLQHSIAEIREIAAAVRAGDGDRAAKAGRRHIEAAAEVALDKSFRLEDWANDGLTDHQTIC